MRRCLHLYLPGGRSHYYDIHTRCRHLGFLQIRSRCRRNGRQHACAENVVLLDLRDRSPVTEFFILATGTSPRQMRTAAEEIQDLGKRMGFKAWHTTGQESAKWILVDCVNVVAHFFDSDSRDFYDLELLWGDCPRIDWRKELGLPPVTEEPKGIRTRINFTDATGLDDMDAEEEGGSQIGDEDDDDDDLDEDDDSDASVMIELPDESTGSNSVEFLEVDPPTKRRKRGRSIYPTTIEDEDTTEEERGMNRIVDLGGRSQSTDEDDAERAAESEAADNVEAVSKEDLAAHTHSHTTDRRGERRHV